MPRPRRRDQDRYRNLGLELAGEPALKTAPQPAAYACPDDDHVGGLLGGDLTEKRRRVSDGRTLLRALGNSVLGGQAREEARGSLAVGARRDALAAVAVNVERRDAVGDMDEDEAQTEPLAELSRHPERAASRVTVDHPQTIVPGIPLVPP
jgi:hypothetical protein